MPPQNASASAFGWDFQVNAAIVLLLENISTVESVRVEGATEDIELLLTSGKRIYSQAKSVEDEYNYNNVRKKLDDALRTLNDACGQEDCEKIIYVTNSPNPFNNVRTMSSFFGRSRKPFAALPLPAKKTIEKTLETLSLGQLDVDKLEVHIIPFFSDDLTERYKVIKDTIGEFLYKLRSDARYLAPTLMDVWQKDFFENSTKKDTAITISKQELMWAIIVFESTIDPNEKWAERLDEALLKEVMIKYVDYINNKVERFEFSVKVINDFQKYANPAANSDRQALCDLFIGHCWKNYCEALSTDILSEEICETVTKVIIRKILGNRYLIDDIRKGVGL